jgi:N-acetylmuramoyl-L-alanine amidase
VKFPFLRLLCLVGLGLGAGAAAPRGATHDGFTRLVFDLPYPTTVTSALLSTESGRLSLQISLQVSLPAESGFLRNPGVSGYTIKGRQVKIELAQGVHDATAKIFPAVGPQLARLVIDVSLPQGLPPRSSGQATVSATTRPPVLNAIRPVGPQLPRLTVVLDAGHGGVDSGMVSRWVVEKEVTLDIAQRVRGYLTQHGVTVIMSRTTDTQLSRIKAQDLEARSRLAQAGTVNAFISIHANAGPGPASGIETFYFGNTLSTSKQSLAVLENGGGSLGQQLTIRASTTAKSLMGDLLAQAKLAFSAQLARHVQGNLIRSTEAHDRGVQSDAFYVIQNPTVPAILTEVGFGSSPTEGPKLAQAGYRDRVAGAMSKGILDFLQVP